MVRTMAVIGILALLLLGAAGLSAFHGRSIEQARAVGHAEGFTQGLSLGLQIQKDAPKNNRL